MEYYCLQCGLTGSGVGVCLGCECENGWGTIYPRTKEEIAEERREQLEEMLQRWDGLSARQWGEDSDAGEINGPRHRDQLAVLEALRTGVDINPGVYP